MFTNFKCSNYSITATDRAQVSAGAVKQTRLHPHLHGTEYRTAGRGMAQVSAGSLETAMISQMHHQEQEQDEEKLVCYTTLLFTPNRQ